MTVNFGRFKWLFVLTTVQDNNSSDTLTFV